MPPTILKTERLILRDLATGDADRLVELMADRAISWNTATIPYPFTREDADAFLARKAQEDSDARTFAIDVAGELAGVIGLVRVGAHDRVWNVGYWIGASYRGKGYMTEALCAVVAVARDNLGARIVTAGQFLDNPASAAVLKKAGFRDTGAREMQFSKGRGCEVEAIRYVVEVGSR